MKSRIAHILLFITIITMDLLTGMEFDLFIPSFPELQVQFDLSPFWVETLLSLNFIGYCLGLFLVGVLADRYGRKPIIVLGLLSFLMGSMLCLWAGIYSFLLIGRFLQGLGIAAPASLSFLIIADTYPLKQQQFLMAMLNGAMNISVAAAPVVGSYVTLYFHWQGNFMALLLVGLVVLVMTLLFIPTQKRSDNKEALSLRGYIPIFQSKPLMLLVVNTVFLIAPYWIFVGISPVLYMEDLGVSLSHFGYYQGVLALIFALGSILYGLIMIRYDHEKMLKLSSYISLTSLIVLAWITYLNSANPFLITLAFIPFIISQIIPATILFPLSLNFMPQAKGRVSAIIHGGRLVLSSIGLEFVGYYYQGSFQNIGINICIYILIAVITLFLVLRNRELMHFAPEKS